jgi:hypothetical protein
MKMADYDSGVSGYIWGECTVNVRFPRDQKGNADINCYQCQFFSRNNGICQLTKEISEFPQKYISSKCPLDFSGEIKELE